MLSLLAHSEYAFAKSRIVAEMSSLELDNYERLSKQIESNINRAKEEIVGTKEEFKEAKVIRKNRLEYEVLAKVIKEQPDRKETDDKLLQLQADLQSLEVYFIFI
jgi:THO complex subunit 7